MPIKGQTKTTKKRTCRLFTKNCSHEPKELDRYWNILSPSTRFRRKWFIFFVIHRKYIEKKMERFISGELRKIFRISPHNLLIGLTVGGKHVWQQEEEQKGVLLYWWFRSNCLFPSSSRTFRTQSYWSFITGQCGNSEQLLPAYLPCWMCVQSSFCHQLWIHTWRSKFEQETDSILPACWSYGQKSQRSWQDWLDSFKLDRMQSFFKKHFQLIVFRKLLEWKLEKSYTKK